MVRIDGLSFGYGRTALFRELALALEPGNIYGLLGVNGAGKSTLLKLISGLLFTAHGSVRTLGQNPASRRPSLLADVFVLPEDAQAPSLSARAYVRSRAPFYPRFDAALFERYRGELELPAEARNLAALSYGQQKKFLLAFGLATRARLVLLDEPTNGLDIPAKSALRRVIAEAVGDDRLFVISTHQVRDLGSLMDPIVILHEGRVLLNATLAEIGSRVHMTQQPTPPAGADDLLFSEPAIGGFWALRRGGGEGPLDVEVLFNAVVANPELASAVLTGGAA